MLSSSPSPGPITTNHHKYLGRKAPCLKSSLDLITNVITHISSAVASKSSSYSCRGYDDLTTSTRHYYLFEAYHFQICIGIFVILTTGVLQIERTQNKITHAQSSLCERSK